MSSRLQETGPTAALPPSKEARAHRAIKYIKVEELRDLGLTSQGLVSIAIRRKAWPLLLAVGDDDQHQVSWQSRLAPHKDEEQIRLDVDRAKLFDTQLSLELFRESLNDIICRFLRNHDDLCYYQGFHDIASVFLTIFWTDQEMAYQTLKMFALQYLRDFMMPTISASVRVVNLVPELLEKVRPDLASTLIPRSLGPFFCLSPIVTAFTHDIHDIESLCLLFDHIIASRRFDTVVYTYVGLLILKHASILEKISLEDDIFSREDLLHNALSKFISSVDRDDVDRSLQEAVSMEKSTPMKNLGSYQALGKFSSLKVQLSGERKSIRGDRYLGQSLIRSQIIECDLLENESNSNTIMASLLANGRNQQLIRASIAIGIVSAALVFFSSTGEI